MLWHPKILTLIYLFKILPGNKTFPFVLIYPFDIMGFYLKWKLSKKDYWTWTLSIIKQFFISGFKLQDLFSQSFILLKWFLLNLEPVLHYNHLTNAFKIPTKIWGCHVRFPHHFYAKVSFGYWRFWALHQFFKSGPVGIFALQPI